MIRYHIITRAGTLETQTADNVTLDHMWTAIRVGTPFEGTFRHCGRTTPTPAAQFNFDHVIAILELPPDTA